MKIKNPLRRRKRTDAETKNKRLSDELSEIGLVGENDETMVDIQKIGSGYVAQVPLSEIKEMYGNINEYIRQQHGPGDYQIIARKKKSTSTRRIKIAGEVDTPPNNISASPSSSPVNDPSAIAMLLELQRENAQLKAQIDMAKTANRSEIWEQVLQIASPLLQGVLTPRNSGSAEAADMLRSTIESVRDLMELSQSIPAGGGGGEEGGLGTIMNAITMFMQSQQAKQQSQPPQVPQAAPMASSKANFAQPNGQSSDGFAKDHASPSVAPTSPPPSQQQTDPFDELVNMVEQKREPQEVAEYLLESLGNLDESQIDATLIPVISQMQKNPLLAWDSLCQMLPILQEGDYASKVKTELEKRV